MNSVQYRNFKSLLKRATVKYRVSYTVSYGTKYVLEYDNIYSIYRYILILYAVYTGNLTERANSLG